MKIKSFKPSFTNLKPVLPGSSPIAQTLRVIPLGGVGDVTKNMYVYEYGNDIIVVDCGMGFPDEGMLGVDLVLPDITYLKERIHKIRGIVITHGHEDHIGGLAYLWPQLKASIYAQPLAAGFIKSKFKENKLPVDHIKTLSLDSNLNLGVFKIGFYSVAHSVPDSTGLIIDTPVGRVIHQSDFKIDWTPVNNQTTDVKKLSQAAESGIRLMLIDGLGSEKAKPNPSERPIENTIFEIAAKTLGKVIVTTNSSSLTRIQQILNVAEKLHKKVALIGRSMETNFQVATELGYINVPPGMIIAPDEIKRFKDSDLLLIMAGSQGQPGSSLSRAANNDHRLVTLKSNDVVIVSANPIPLSMNTYYALIDKLSRMGIDVYYSDIQENLHVSGHASSEEIKLMVSLAKPEYIMPIGTTFRGMRAFARLMKGLGYKDENIITLETQKVILVTKSGVEYGEHIETQNVYVDGLGVGDVGTVVLRDRQVLAEEGIVVVILPIDYQTGRLAGEADIISRGFVFEKTSEELLTDARRVVDSALSDHKEGPLDWRFVRSHIEENLEKFFYEETKRRPMILPVVVEV